MRLGLRVGPVPRLLVSLAVRRAVNHHQVRALDERISGSLVSRYPKGASRVVDCDLREGQRELRREESWDARGRSIAGLRAA